MYLPFFTQHYYFEIYLYCIDQYPFYSVFKNILCIYHYSVLCLPLDGYLGYFQLLALLQIKMLVICTSLCMVIGFHFYWVNI